MYEQPTDHTSEGRATRRLPVDPGGVRAPQAPADHTRVLAFVLIGLGVAMLVSNLGKVSFGGGRDQNHPVVVERQAYTEARIDFDWGDGLLRVQGGQGNDIVSGSVDAAKAVVPDVRRERDDGQQFADITIEAPSTGWLFGSTLDAEGNLSLNDEIRYSVMQFDLGSGSAELDLSALNVGELNIDGGSGDISLQLPTASTAGEIETGSGALSLTLPPETAARIVVDRGSGEFSPGDRLRLVDGDADDGVYETPDFGTAQQRIELNLDTGSGDVTIN